MPRNPFANLFKKKEQAPEAPVASVVDEAPALDPVKEQAIYNCLYKLDYIREGCEKAGFGIKDIDVSYNPLGGGYWENSLIQKKGDDFTQYARKHFEVNDLNALEKQIDKVTIAFFKKEREIGLESALEQQGYKEEFMKKLATAPHPDKIEGIRKDFVEGVVKAYTGIEIKYSTSQLVNGERVRDKGKLRAEEITETADKMSKGYVIEHQKSKEQTREKMAEFLSNKRNKGPLFGGALSMSQAQKNKQSNNKIRANFNAKKNSSIPRRSGF